MPADMHVVENDASIDYEPANDTIYAGDLVVRESGGGVHAFDPASDSRIDGIVPRMLDHATARDHDEDWTSNVSYSYELYEYSGNGNADATDTDIVPIQPLGDAHVIAPFTIEDTSLTEPSISRNDKVVAVNINGRPRIVEDGYSDGNNSTYNESNNNAIDLGRLDHYAEMAAVEDQYAENLEVRLDADIFA